MQARFDVTRGLLTPQRSSANGNLRKTLLVLSQVYVPDPTSVGQYMADVVTEMARRGNPVRVLTSARGYADASVRYPPLETAPGIEVRRLPMASFGKKSILTRVIGSAAFMAQALFAGLFTRNIGGILFSTSPPLVGVVASVIGMLRKVPTAYWAMDLNPDQLIALHKLRQTGFPARLLEGVNRHILRSASLVIALDRFMADRLEPRGRLGDKMRVMPPWPHEDHISPARSSADSSVPGNSGSDSPGGNPFRRRHGLAGKFVVMYSGNHSPSNPLTTLLDTAVRLKNDPDLRFVFVGGGTGKDQVEAAIKEHGLTNVISLPYEPLSQLRYSLPAADLHVVSLGQEMVGIIHPCKVYGAMAAARPILYFGPRPSHVTQLLDDEPFGRHVEHGDVDGAVRAIQELRALSPAALAEMGQAGYGVIRRSLSQEALCRRFCDWLEESLFGDGSWQSKNPGGRNALVDPAHRDMHAGRMPEARA